MTKLLSILMAWSLAELVVAVILTLVVVGAALYLGMALMSYLVPGNRRTKITYDNLDKKNA